MRETDPILLGELQFLVSVNGDQVKRTSAPCLGIDVLSKLLQYGRDHLAWSTPTERQDSTVRSRDRSAYSYGLGIEIDQDDFIACVQCHFIEGLGRASGRCRVIT